jgi:hypothetical protein
VGNAGYCRPVCATDSDCPSGYCDPVHAACVPQLRLDRTLGRQCGAAESDGGGAADSANKDGAADGAAEADADGAAAEGGQGLLCDGLCVRLDDATSVCSHRCVFGEMTECAASSGGLRRGGCVFASVGGGIGDVGYCAELCDCSDDCIEPTFVCDAFDDAGLEAAFGRKGVCTATELVIKRVLACGP